MPPDLIDVLLLALMNPATLAAGFLVGRRADQPQKLVLAAFVAGIAGAVFAWLLILTGLYPPKVRLLGGVFVASAILGIGWAWLGYTFRRHIEPE
jgi:hypothetical protein